MENGEYPNIEIGHGDDFINLHSDGDFVTVSNDAIPELIIELNEIHNKLNEEKRGQS